MRGKTTRKLARLHWLWSAILAQKVKLVLGVLLLTGSISMSALEPVLLGKLVDVWSKDFARYPSWIGTDSSDGVSRVLVVLYAAILFTRIGCVIAQARVFERIAEGVLHTVRKLTLAHSLRLTMDRVDVLSPGHIASRAINDVDSLRDLLSTNAIKLVYSVGLLTSYCIGMLWADLYVASASILLIPMLVYVLSRCVQHMKKRFILARALSAKMNSRVAETVTGMKIIQTEQLGSSREAAFDQVALNLARANGSIATAYGGIYFAITYYTGIAMVLVIAIGLKRIEDGVMTPGALVTVAAYLFSISQPLRELIESLPLIVMGFGSADRIADFLDEETESGSGSQDTTGPEEDSGTAPLLNLKDVYFNYPASDPVLGGINLTVHKNEWIGIVGKTGSGKSTLLKLLVGMYTPTRGTISVGALDASSFSLKKLRNYVGLIEQSPYLFAGSVQDNITIFAASLSSDALLACEMLGLSHRLSEEIQEKGSNLSLGDRQKIAVIRAIQSRASVWVFDEPTSALDPENERQVLAVIEKFRRHRAMIMVAHRLETLNGCDKIYELKAGVLRLQDGTRLVEEFPPGYSRLTSP